MNTRYQLIITESYKKKLGKFLKSHPELFEHYKKTIMLLELNPKHPSLRFHKLEGKLEDLYSISINMNYRIVFYIEDNHLIPIDIGNHNQVYQ